MITLAFAATLLVQSPDPARCVPGEWQIENIDVDASGQGTATPAELQRYCLAEGRVVMEEFRAFSPAGDIIARGASFVVASSEGLTSQTLWVMTGDEGYTYLRGVQHGTTETQFGGGYDLTGEFLERSTTIPVPGTSGDEFTMDRSYDGGRSWVAPYNVIRRSPAGAPTPPLPEAFAPVLGENIERFASDAGYLPILDGHAGLRIEESRGEISGLHFTAVYPAPSRLRELRWDLRNGYVSTTEHLTTDPRNEWAVFTSERTGNGDIYAINLASRETISIATGPHPQGSVRADVAGGRIVIQEVDGENAVLMTGDQSIVASPNADVAPDWSPAGNWIVWSAPQQDGRETLVLSPTDFSRTIPIVATGRNRYPVWSPRGGQIAFARQTGAGWGIFVLDLRSPQPDFEQLTSDFAQAGHPAWSPDGDRIAFDATIDGDTEIVIADSDTGRIRQVIRREGVDLAPAWTADGLSVVFNGMIEGDNELSRADVETGSVERLTNSPGFDGGAVVVSGSLIGR